MNVIQRIKNACDKFLGFDPAEPNTERTGYTRTTTASRRAYREANTKYLHKSITLTKVPDALVPLVGSAYIVDGKGTSYTTRNGAAKREADRMSAQFGFSNKLRRRMRAGVRARMEELA